MKILPSISRRAYVLSGTLLAVLAVFVFYLYVYVPNREEKLIQQRMRALEQTAVNFQEKWNVYQRNADKIASRLKKEVKMGESVKAAYQGGIDSWKEKIKSLEEKQLLLEKRDSLERTLKSQKEQEIPDNEDLIQLKYSIAHSQERIIHLQDRIKGVEDSIILRIKEDGLNVNLEVMRPGFKGMNENLIFTRFNVSLTEGQDTNSFIIKSGFNNFYESLKRPDIFDDYFIFKGETTNPVYQSKSGSLFLVKEGYANPGDPKDKRKIFSLNEINVGATFGQVEDVKLGTEDYKLFSTSFLMNKTTWYLYGLVSNDRFEAEKRRIPSILIISFLVPLLLLLFSMPLLKLVFMSPIERLYQYNVIHAAVSFILSFSLIVLCILSLDSYLVDEKKRVDNNLKKLSNTVKEDMKVEMGLMATLLVELGDNKIDSMNIIKKESKNIFSDDSLLSHFSKYPFFDYVYWMDKDGKVKFEYNSSRKLDSKIDEADNYGERSYFKAIADNKPWYLGLGEKTRKAAFLESITAWTNGTSSVVLSMPTNPKNMPLLPVIAMATQMHSIIDPALPPGYKFHIIDKNGLVLFHTDKTRNLQENYLEECSQNKNISSALASNIPIYTDVPYHHQDYRAFMQPLDHTPWFLVLSYDTRYSDLPYSQIIIFTLFSSLLLSFLVGTLSAVVSLLYRKPSKLKRDTFSFEWLRPQQKMKLQYLIILLLNAAYLFLLIIYNSQEEINPLQTLLSFTIAIILLFLFSFALLQKKSWRYKFIIRIVFVFLICLFLTLHLLQGISIIDLGLLGSLVGLWFLFLRNSNRSQLTAYVKKTEDLLRITDFKKAYLLMMFSFLIICSLISTFFLFTKFYEQEMIVWEKANLFQIHQQLEKKENDIKERYMAISSELKAKGRRSKNALDSVILIGTRKGLHYQELGYTAYDSLPDGNFFNGKEYLSAGLLKEIKNGTTIEVSEYENKISKFRPFLSRLIEDNNGFVFTKSGGSKWKAKYFNQAELGVLFNGPPKEPNLYFVYDRTPEKDGTRILAGNKLLYFNKYHFSAEPGNFIFFGILMGIIVAVYIALKYSLKDFYTWGLISRKEVFQIDDIDFLNKRNSKPLNSISSNLFIVTMPFAGLQNIQYPKNKLLTYLASLSHNFSLSQLYDKDYYISKLKYVTSIKNETVVLEHFGYNAKNILVNSRKLQILEQLLLNGNKVVIVSGVRPLQIIEFYECQIEEYKLHSEAEKAKIDINNVKDQLSRWKDILSGFIKIYPGLSRERKFNLECNVQDMINYECRASYYFYRLKPFLKNLPSTIMQSADRELKEDVLLKIQSMAQPFYFSLWNTCSKEEKYLLYDLASDDFVNTKNVNCIVQLIEKGLIYMDNDDRLHLMNESFRNFVLTNIKESEALEMEREVTQNGTFSIFKAVIFVIAISALLFVSFAEQAWLESVVAVLAGVAALIPSLLRLGNWFGPASDLGKA